MLAPLDVQSSEEMHHAQCIQMIRPQPIRPLALREHPTQQCLCIFIATPLLKILGNALTHVHEFPAGRRLRRVGTLQRGQVRHKPLALCPRLRRTGVSHRLECAGDDGDRERVALLFQLRSCALLQENELDQIMDV